MAGRAALTKSMQIYVAPLFVNMEIKKTHLLLKVRLPGAIEKAAANS